MPAAAATAEARRIQIVEREFWMARDIAQTGNNRDICEEKREMYELIQANNASAR